MHAGYHVKGLGQVPSTLDTTGSGTWRKGLQMVKTETGVWCTAPGDANQTYGFFIPDTNCIGFTIDPKQE